MNTYTVRYLQHNNPHLNGNKGKHWIVLKENGKKHEFTSIESAMNEFSHEKEWREKVYPNDVFVKVRIMSGKEIVKEIDF